MEITPETMTAEKQQIENWIKGFQALLLISSPEDQDKINNWIKGFKTLLEL